MQIRVITQSFLDIRDQIFEISFDGKMVHGHISVDLVVAVPLLCIITRANRQATDCEPMLPFRVEQGMHDFVSLLVT
ncbi:hypothetical protein D3C75_1308080 [compost metagenome]